MPQCCKIWTRVNFLSDETGVEILSETSLYPIYVRKTVLSYEGTFCSQVCIDTAGSYRHCCGLVGADFVLKALLRFYSVLCIIENLLL